MKKELRLSVLLKTSDMYDFILRHTYSNFSGRFGIVLSVGAFIYLIVGYNNNSDYKNLLLIVISSLFTVINPLLLRLKAKQQVTLNPMFKTPLKYLINEEGILVSQHAQELKITWNDIIKVTETKRSYILYLNAVRAYIFPKNSLKDQKELFLEIIKENVDQKKCKFKRNKI